MAIKSREELLNSIRDRFNEDSSDETLAIIEDISDTFADLEHKAKGDGKDWKAEAERIDNEWREKYKARFFSSGSDTPDDDIDKPDEIENLTFENLFKEG